MLRINPLRIMVVSVACATGLAAQNFPRPAIAPSPDDQAGVNIAAVPADQGGAADPAQRPQFNDPPPPPNGNYAGNYAPAANVPATLTLPSGVFVTVRVSQWLSSDRNQTGDTFYATLTQPLMVNGIVVARRGSTIIGRVSEVKKSHTDGSSRLGLQLTSLSLVDGQEVQIQSQVVDRNGSTVSPGRQAAAIGTTTAVGAGIGAAAAGGVGAAIGAGAGLAASGIGVMLTRGRPTEVYPETMLTFRLDAPVSISTTQATAAFRYASQEDYGMAPQGRMAQQMPPRPEGPGSAAYGAYGVSPYPYSPYPYSPYPYYSPYYYGQGFSVFVGPRFYGGFRGGFGRGFRR